MVWHIKWLGPHFSALVFSAALSATSLAKEPGPTFPKKKIAINKVILEVEVASTPEQQSHGLMYRKQLPDTMGMIFVFQNSEIRSFWMKNTYIDLSIGYFDKNKVLFQIVDMKGTSVMQKDFPSYPSSGPALFALEVSKGWFNRKGIKLGDKFEWR